MAIGLRKKKLIYAGLLGAGIMLSVSAVGGYFLYQKAEAREIQLKNEYQAQMEILEKIAEQSHEAYALKEEVKKGEVITFEDVEKVYVPPGANSEDLILYDIHSGKTNYFARTDLKPHTIVTASLVYEDDFITDDMREGEYAFIELPTNIEHDKYVDLRIQFPSGDDYIFMAKKKLKDVQGLTVRFDLDEGEILTMSSAIVDAYIEGAKIYAMPYVDEHMQVASTVTYPVKENVKQLIIESPNIVNLAKLNLEKQNRIRLETTLQNMEENQKSLKTSGDQAVKNKQEADEAKRTAEERINALNEKTQSEQQQELVGGSDE